MLLKDYSEEVVVVEDIVLDARKPSLRLLATSSIIVLELSPPTTTLLHILHPPGVLFVFHCHFSPLPSYPQHDSSTGPSSSILALVVCVSDNGIARALQIYMARPSLSVATLTPHYPHPL